jgi:WD40 repeat protein
MKNDNTNPPFFLLAPAQVSFTPDGNGLVATLKGTNTIHYWSLSTLGFPSDQQVISPSNGFTPFSFAFDNNGHLLVSEAFGAAPAAPLPPTPNNGAVSSYNINEDGSLSVISKSVPTGQTATCWIRYFNGRAYTSNNEPPNPSISIFSVDDNGVVEIVDQVAANGEQGIDRAIDLSLTADGEFLYSLSTGSLESDGAGRARISVFKNQGDSLNLVEIVKEGLPLSTTTLNFAETEGVFGLAVL